MEKDPARLREEAIELDRQADAKRREAREAELGDLRAKPILERLIYAAGARCDCGAGLAYDPTSEGRPDSPFKGPSAWECGDILRFDTLDEEKRAAVKAAVHTAPLPFAFYEVKSEKQPSANGATTRPEA